MNIWVVCNLFFVAAVVGAQDSSFKVAVIGGGVAGASSTYFLRHSSLSAVANVTIDLYEKSYALGGRAAETEINGHLYRVGPDVLHDSNMLMKELMKSVGVTAVPVSDALSFTLGLWTGSQLIMSIGNSETSAWMRGTRAALKILKQHSITTSRILERAVGAVRLWPFIWRYFRRWIETQTAIKNMMEKWMKQYNATATRGFDDVQTMFSHLGLAHLLNQTFAEIHSVEQSSAFETDVVGATCRGIYGQDHSINAFATNVALLGTGVAGGLLTPHGGWSQVPRKIIERDATVAMLDHEVVSLETQRNVKVDGLHIDGVRLHFTTTAPATEGASPQSFRDYDAVVIAVPLELANITFNGHDLWSEKSEGRANDGRTGLTHGPTRRTFVPVYQTWCSSPGLRKDYFFPGTEAEGVLEVDNILVGDDAEDLFNSITLETPVDGVPVTSSYGEKVYKVSSGQQLSEETLDKIFINCTSSEVIKQWAYPLLPPLSPSEMPWFKLTSNIYYVNAIESAASATELSALGGRNAAFALEKALRQRSQSQ